jgi:hypothetical protein
MDKPPVTVLHAAMLKLLCAVVVEVLSGLIVTVCSPVKGVAAVPGSLNHAVRRRTGRNDEGPPVRKRDGPS